MNPNCTHQSHFRPCDFYDTRNLTDEEYERRNLCFDRERESAKEKIIRVFSEQRQKPKLVMSVVGVVQNWEETHILTKGGVVIYRDPHTEDLRNGEQPHDDRVLLRSSWSDRNHNVEIEFENGDIVETSTFYLLWTDFLVDADYPLSLTNINELGNHLVATRVPDSHRFGHIDPFVLD